MRWSAPPTGLQGRDAENEIVSAINWLARGQVDCLALIRGGGSRSDLAVFDSRAVAEAIALAPVPVLTGLGHEIDQAIADLTAHTAFKTPTKVAEFLVERALAADRRVASAQSNPENPLWFQTSRDARARRDVQPPESSRVRAADE